MPVPVLGLRTGSRPDGRVTPVDRCDGQPVELRVHGVGSTPVSDLLGDLAPCQVAGDLIAGFYRTDDLSAADGSGVRHVEGYSWGGLNSRSAVRALWLLLFPFLLGNLVGWTVSSRVRSCRPAYRLHRAVTSLLCLVLTMNAVTLLCSQVLQVATYQAAAPGPAQDWWMWPTVWPSVRGYPQRGLVLGYAAILLVILFLLILTGRARNRYESVQPPRRVGAAAPDSATPACARDGLHDPRFWISQTAADRAAGHHGSAALATLALIMASVQRSSAESANPGWVQALWYTGVGLALATLVVSALALALAGRVQHGLRAPWNAYGVVPVIVIGVVQWYGPAPVFRAGDAPGLERAGVGMTLLVVTVLVLLCLPPVLAWARHRDHVPPPGRTLRGAPVLAAVWAFGSLNLAGVGILVALVRATAPDGTQVAAIADTIAWALLFAFWGVVAAFAVILLVVVAGLHRAGRRPPDPAETEHYLGDYDTVRHGTPDREKVWLSSTLYGHEEGGEDDRAWLRRVARWQWLGQEMPGRVLPLLWLTVIMPVLLCAVVEAGGSPRGTAWFNPDGGAGGLATTVTVLLPGILIVLIQLGWRKPLQRRRIGVLWDVAAFWPRSFHPLAPPCYAERAVPDLQRRLWWLADSGSPITLVGHSQGSVLAAAAVLPGRQSLPDDARIHLVTFGAPLVKLYTWGFPAWLNQDVLRAIGPGGAGSSVQRWDNFWYRTDPVAGPVFDSLSGTGPGIDHLLPDPVRCWYRYGQPQPHVGAHSGYWSDERMWSQIYPRATPADQAGVPSPRAVSRNAGADQ